jgi:hypothetical protein
MPVNSPCKKISTKTSSGFSFSMIDSAAGTDLAMEQTEYPALLRIKLRLLASMN